MERKETELEQMKAGNARSTIESQRPRAVSPYRMPRCGTSAGLKPETSQRPIDDTKSFEVSQWPQGICLTEYIRMVVFL